MKTKMQVVLVRHAESVPETLALRDPHRHLTQHGRDQARALGDRLRGLVTPTHVWTSPLVRAVQTAELVVRSELLVEGVPALAPDGNAHDVVNAVTLLGAGAIVMLVGHEPSLSGIGALLVGDPSFAGLAKAEAVHVQGGGVRARIAWSEAQ